MVVTVAEALDMAEAHPYFPPSVALPTYAANTLRASELVPIFGAGCLVIFSVTNFVAKRSRPNLSRGEALTTMWFVLCGFIHLFFEGYFAYNALDMASRTDIFGQLWKEYSLSDSRYLTQDSFVVCMETITAVFWGPMSFACAYCIVKQHPMRHPLQMIISLGQLYGDVLYYATCSFSEAVFKIVYCRPEQMYYWAYYVLCNAFWIVIPLFLLVKSASQTAKAFAKVDAMEKRAKSV